MPAGSVALIVEVADTTLEFDLGPKAALYAAAGIPEYWVVDLPNKLLHQHRASDAAGYGKPDPVRLGEQMAAHAIPGLGVASAGLA